MFCTFQLPLCRRLLFLVLCQISPISILTMKSENEKFSCQSLVLFCPCQYWVRKPNSCIVRYNLVERRTLRIQCLAQDHSKPKQKQKHNRVIFQTPETHPSPNRPSHFPDFNDTHINYMTYFRLQASSRLCLAFQLATDLRVLIPSAGHVRVEVGARLEKGLLALSLQG